MLAPTSADVPTALPWYKTDAAAATPDQNGLLPLPRCGTMVAAQYQGAQVRGGGHSSFLFFCVRGARGHNWSIVVASHTVAAAPSLSVSVAGGGQAISGGVRGLLQRKRLHVVRAGHAGAD